MKNIYFFFLTLIFSSSIYSQTANITIGKYPLDNDECNPSINVSLKQIGSPGTDRPVTWSSDAIWNSWTCKIYLDYIVNNVSKTSQIDFFRFNPSQISYQQYNKLQRGTNMNLPSGVPFENFTKARVVFTKETIRWALPIPGEFSNDQEVIFSENFRSNDIDIVWCPPIIDNGNIDSDGDGIPDSIDKCPGHDDNIDSDSDGIPDGCDGTNNNAKPNLTLSGFKVKVGSTTYDAFATTNNEPEFKYGENHTFTIIVENNDDGNASSSNCKILVSEEKIYPYIGNKPVYEYRTFDLGAISGNSNKEVTFSEYFYDYISLLNLENDKTYYLIIHIDYDDLIDESNENYTDNVKYVEFKYKKTSSSTSGKVGLKVNSNDAITDVDFNYNRYDNNLKFLNLQYRELRYDRDFYGKNSTIDISTLPNGLYSIYVNNVYIKKISLDTGIEISLPGTPD